jgi:hypothetical protein
MTTKKRILEQFEEACGLLDAKGYVETHHTAPHKALLAINNSFILRDLIKETSKSSLYMCADINPGTPATLNVASLKILDSETAHRNEQVIIHGPSKTASLAKAIDTQSKFLGKLIFVLIGKLDKTLQAEAHIGHPDYNTLRYDPSLASDFEVDDVTKTIQTRVLGDLGGLAASIAASTGTQPSSELLRALAEALDHLENEAVVKVRGAVKARKNLSSSLLGELAASLRSERIAYTKAIAAYVASASQDDYHRVLRIAYNFSSDAIRIIHLLICIADLKPLVMWSTVASHVRTAKSFEALPWLSTGKKASLGAYKSIIGNARNRAFHNFFAFNRTLDVVVDGVSLKATRLRLFRPYKRSKDTGDAFRYEDQNLVDLLVGFTRATERVVELGFLKANAKVMQATEGLVKETAEALYLLRA